MRLHTNRFRADAVVAALIAEQTAGRIAATVQFKVLVEHGSRSHDTAVEVQLSSWDKAPGDGRRCGNSGSYGSMSGDDYAALYSEWGWLLAALYRIDPEMVAGSVKHPVYRDAEDFHNRTGATYALMELLPLLEAGNDPYPYSGPRSRVGREGADRYAEPVTAWGSAYTRWAPRTPEWYRAFAKI